MSWEKIVVISFVVGMLIWLSLTTNFIKEVAPPLGETGKALWNTAQDTTEKMKDLPPITIPKK